MANGKVGDGSEVGISFRDVLGFLLRGAPPALLVAAAAAAGAFLAVGGQAPLYRATATVLATHAADGYGANVMTPPRVDPQVYRSAVLDGPLLSRALHALAGAPPAGAALDEWRRRVTVRADEGLISSLVRVAVEDVSPERAAALANRIAAELLAWDRDRARRALLANADALAGAVATIDAELAGLGEGEAERAAALIAAREQRLRELDAARVAASSAATVGLLEPFQQAQPDLATSDDRTALTVALASLLGAFATYLIRLAARAGASTIGSAAELERAAGAPILAELPRSARSGPSLAGAQLGRLYVTLTRSADPAAGRVILVTSARHAHEKAGLAAQLARGFATSGQRTLLVDADLLEPLTTRRLHPQAVEGVSLEEHLLGPPRPPRALRIPVGQHTGFDFVPSYGSAEPAVHLFEWSFRAQLAEWRDNYDTIVIDAAPVLPGADALALAEHCTRTVLAATRGATRIEDVREATELLRRCGALLQGAILIGGRPPAAGRAARRPGRREARAAAERRAGRAVATVASPGAEELR